MNSNLPLKSTAKIFNFECSLTLKVIDLHDFISTGEYGNKYCLKLDGNPDHVGDILNLEWGAIIIMKGFSYEGINCLVIYDLSMPEIVSSGDIISVSPNGIYVSYRKKSNSNVLFVTERCNHNCIMCSQPPREIKDEWRINECHAIIEFIDKNEKVLGISGGEPTLLGEQLIDLIKHCKNTLPSTQLHILTNGTAFHKMDYVEKISQIEHSNIIWGIPLYGSTPQQHDFHTQVKGSFNKVVHGIYNLASKGQSVELRIVLTRSVLVNIRDIMEFILWNMPFVNTVAMMGVESTGYAKSNYELVWDEIESYIDNIYHSIKLMQCSPINVLLYNIPLCKLPIELHNIAVKSISDWKNVFYEKCESCEKIELCGGFFNSHKTAKFTSKEIVPF
ncbi:molybdenum cofactor biosynthesis protein A [Vibrio ruber DSM 16370]|uniref:Molybdenum cofactor biosynthesis protein A n=1 Tax=Vibrio ruber (strain DSM 16370 / JCM 11486 / BCRC 17186 / CECT 7878 / LMG 23124 / VR1) TaxID=1123498 RepID=A0A1R4LC52_VIBR1|nr:His-Xaa-Ser system radical SAM maturase HxsC [Vibrio ruber]SJN54125.1 molybdenum cofactor biosynthesis protein A [Vibrio ruber DSM 16370]